MRGRVSMKEMPRTGFEPARAFTLNQRRPVASKATMSTSSNISAKLHHHGPGRWLISYRRSALGCLPLARLGRCYTAGRRSNFIMVTSRSNQRFLCGDPFVVQSANGTYFLPTHHDRMNRSKIDLRAIRVPASRLGSVCEFLVASGLAVCGYFPQIFRQVLALIDMRARFYRKLALWFLFRDPSHYDRPTLLELSYALFGALKFGVYHVQHVLRALFKSAHYGFPTA